MYLSIELNSGWRICACATLAIAWIVAAGCGKQPTGETVPGIESPVGANLPSNPQEAVAGQLFSGVALESGVRFTYRNGREGKQYRIIEMLGGGVGMLDYDNDGLLDLCFPGGGVSGEATDITGRPTGLLRNLGGFQWTAVDQVAAVNQVPGQFEYTHGIAVADYNNDGFPDFYLTSYTGGMLYTNQGDGTFLTWRLGDRLLSTSAAWGDLDEDGSLDLYVAHYARAPNGVEPICHTRDGEREVCPPRDYEPLPDALYFSDGDGEFRPAADAAGLRTDGRGLGALILDLDRDGHVDIYVANDTTDNFLYLNDGAGRLREVGVANGVALSERGMPDGSMGVDALDFNNDQQTDLWVSNYESESFALYRGEGHGQFLHVSQSTGVTAVGGLYVGFGTSCGDFDLDGDEDVFITNGHVLLHPVLAPLRQLPLFLENQRGKFRRIKANTGYLAEANEGRGLASGDLDNDGDLDVCISHLNENVALLRNDSEDRRWLGLRLIGTVSNRDAIGARVTLKTTQGDLLRHVKGGGSYLSSSDKRLCWGFPTDAEPTEVLVEWPSGIRQSWAVDRYNCFMTVIEARPDGPR